MPLWVRICLALLRPFVWLLNLVSRGFNRWSKRASGLIDGLKRRQRDQPDEGVNLLQRQPPNADIAAVIDTFVRDLEQRIVGEGPSEQQEEDISALQATVAMLRDLSTKLRSNEGLEKLMTNVVKNLRRSKASPERSSQSDDATLTKKIPSELSESCGLEVSPHTEGSYGPPRVSSFEMGEPIAGPSQSQRSPSDEVKSRSSETRTSSMSRGQSSRSFDARSVNVEISSQSRSHINSDTGISSFHTRSTTSTGHSGPSPSGIQFDYHGSFDVAMPIMEGPTPSPSPIVSSPSSEEEPIAGPSQPRDFLENFPSNILNFISFEMSPISDRLSFEILGFRQPTESESRIASAISRRIMENVHFDIVSPTEIRSIADGESQSVTSPETNQVKSTEEGDTQSSDLLTHVTPYFLNTSNSCSINLGSTSRETSQSPRPTSSDNANELREPVEEPSQSLPTDGHHLSKKPLKDRKSTLDEVETPSSDSDLPPRHHSNQEDTRKTAMSRLHPFCSEPNINLASERHMPSSSVSSEVFFNSPPAESMREEESTTKPKFFFGSSSETTENNIAEAASQKPVRNEELVLSTSRPLKMAPGPSTDTTEANVDQSMSQESVREEETVSSTEPQMLPTADPSRNVDQSAPSQEPVREEEPVSLTPGSSADTTEKH